MNTSPELVFRLELGRELVDERDRRFPKEREVDKEVAEKEPQDGLFVLALFILEPLHGRHPLPEGGNCGLHDFGLEHEAEHGGAGDVLSPNSIDNF